ncbi:hypothetical protein PM082_007048 [Marasmius tenuissimus]|nr:hypothetical protein PM082_007048 [Marasmius tenuissimus]
MPPSEPYEAVPSTITQPSSPMSVNPQTLYSARFQIFDAYICEGARLFSDLWALASCPSRVIATNVPPSILIGIDLFILLSP